MSNALGMERKKELVGASDRSFGLMFAVVFALATGLIQLRFESLTSRVAPILLLLGSLSLPEIEGDLEQLIQAVLNLARNAAQAMQG